MTAPTYSPQIEGSGVRIVRANTGQAAQLSNIAWSAKTHWGYPAHWMESWRESLTIQAEEIETNDYYVAESDGRAVGFCAVHGGAGEWRLWHLWILPEWHGHGVGRQLFRRAAVCVRERGGSWFDVQSDPHAEGFYLRMGAVRIGETDATMDDMPRCLIELRYALV